MLNRDIYNQDPKENRLVNNGVAEVSEDHLKSRARHPALRAETRLRRPVRERAETIPSTLQILLNLGSKAEHGVDFWPAAAANRTRPKTPRARRTTCRPTVQRHAASPSCPRVSSSTLRN